MKKSLHALAACMAFALAVQIPASSFASAHVAAPNGPTDQAPAGPVVLPTATLDAITGAVNWRKVACWTGVVGVAVGASLAGSPVVGAGASAAMAIICLAAH